MPSYFDQDKKATDRGMDIHKEKGLQHRTYLIKINSQWMMNLNVKDRTLKLLEKGYEKILESKARKELMAWTWHQKHNPQKIKLLNELYQNSAALPKTLWRWNFKKVQTERKYMPTT